MWTFLRKILARSRLFNAALGDVVYKTLEVGGQNSHSFLEWRVKRDLEGDALFIGLRMIPDTYVGPEGSPTNYMNFDIESAQLIRDHLDMCIMEYNRLIRDNRSGRAAVS